MEVETQKPPMSETWTRWEGQSVNGAFPLRRCLGSSDHSGVFLTEYAEQNLPNVALKLVPAIPTLAESQLSHWGAAASLEHPHLIRLFETGRCQLGGSHYLYVVMDYAEQNLAQLLLHRALSAAEVREMLPLTLEALAFLHSRDFVHGQLKPSNVLVVGNRLALSSDTIRPAAEATASIGMLSIHNPPEARDGSFSTAGDVWALGVTLCQALTQRVPLKSGERRDLVVLPPDIPEAFNDILRRCLARNPAERPSVVDLQEWLKKGPAALAQPASVSGLAGADTLGVPAASGSAVFASAAAEPAAFASATAVPAASASTSAPVTAVPATAVSAAAEPARAERKDAATRLVIRAVINREPPAPEPVERRSFVSLMVGAVAVVAVGWGAVSWYRGHSHAHAVAADESSAAMSQGQQSPSAPRPGDAAGATAPGAMAGGQAPGSAPSDSTASAPANTTSPPTGAPGSGSARAASGPRVTPVVQDIPSVPAGPRSTIHGHVKVTVRVTIDNSGAVVDDTLTRPGPSHYFAHLASESARRWRFEPANTSGARQSLIRFDFSRTGTTAHVASSD